MQVSFVTYTDPSTMGQQLTTFEQSIEKLMEVVEYGVPQLDSNGYWVAGQFLAGGTGNFQDDRRSIVSYFGSFNWQQQPLMVRGIRLSDKITFDWQGFESIPDFLSIRKSSPSFVNPDPTLFSLSPARQLVAITAPPSPLPPNWEFSQEKVYLDQLTNYTNSILSGQYPKGSVLNPGDIAEGMIIQDPKVVYYPVVTIQSS